MVNTTRSRANHYETLGLKPSASSEEIARAFAREISGFRPRAFADLAQVSVAYATLRDPAKRKAYDASLGLGPKPAPPKSLMGWRVGPQFIASAPVRSRMRPESSRPAPAAPHDDPRPSSQPADEQKLPSFIAALRDLAEPAAHDGSARPHSRPEPVRPPEAKLEPRPEPESGGDRSVQRPDEVRLSDVDYSPIDWKRPAMAIGGVFVAVGVLGAVAGWSAGIVKQPEPPESRVTVAVPKARPPASVDAAALAPAWSYEARPEAPRRAAVARTKSRPPLEVSVPEELQGEAAQAGRTQFVDLAIEQAAAEAPQIAAAAEPAPAPAVAADMRLPKTTIARTIGRIGYGCGEVASTTPVDGAPGVFKVTCTSGHSYQAKPVRGRYHFRRWSSR